ncbi:MAG: hypothetical protein ACI8ZB_004739 [Desulforhopalus sp.]|jgi:uncharacterized protein with ATP-grasp and redox domains
MKTNIACLPCLLRQTLQTTRLYTGSTTQQAQTVQAVAAYLAGCDLSMCPPAIVGDVYEIIEQNTGAEDPYVDKKRESNDIARSLLPALEQEIVDSDDKEGLMLAIRFAIAGNIIDYGAYQNFDIEGTLQRCRNAVLAIDHSANLLKKIEILDEGANILYLADNCGEIVFDSLLIGKLFARGFKITVAVKDGPIINDALVSDAYTAGLDKYARIISNGTRCPGTVLEQVSPQFLDVYNSADLVISKGQGNFESLSEAKREIFFLLTIKCVAAAEHMHEITGCDQATVTGTGEMAVFRLSPKIKKGSL